MELVASWVNGVAGDSISIQSRGLAYGDGVFETILCCADKPQHWARHKARLQRACASLYLDFPDNIDAQVAQAMQAVVTAYSVLKIIVVRAESASGYNFSSHVSDTLITLAEFKPLPVKPLHIGIASSRLAINAELAGIKHLSRIEQLMASAEAQQVGVDDLLMLDAQNNIVESISSNVFFNIAGQWCTPSLNHAGVAGVMREYILEEFLVSHSMDCQISDIPVTALKDCSSAFICNSLRGVRPIATLNGLSLDINPVKFFETLNTHA